MASNKRDQLVDTALRLFRRHGYHATGIDTILAEAGVAKMTLYNHFKSKEELILAVLRRRDELFRNWFMKRVEQITEDPRQRVLAIFEVLGEWFSDDDFSGCMFINASAEYADHNDPIHAISAEHKRLLLNYLCELATAAAAADPDRMAMDMMLLVEGATVWAHVTGDTSAAATAERGRNIHRQPCIHH